MAVTYPDAPITTTPNTKPFVTPDKPTSQYDVNTGGSDFELDKVSVDPSDLGYQGTGNQTSFDAGNSFINDDSLAVNQVGGLLEKGSMLYDIGESKGLSQAAGRGLLNSDMGVEAGVRGGIAEIMPAVLNDSQILGQADLAHQGAEYTSELKNQEGDISGALAEQGANIEGALNDQTAQYHAGLATQGAELAGAQTTQAQQYQQSSMEYEALLQSELATQEWDNKFSAQVFDAQQAAMRDRMNLEFNELIQNNQITLEEQKALSDAYMELSKNYEISVQNIILDPDMNGEAKTAALNQLQAIFEQDMSNISDLWGGEYNRTIDIDGNPIINGLSYDDVIKKYGYNPATLTKTHLQEMIQGNRANNPTSEATLYLEALYTELYGDVM